MPLRLDLIASDKLPVDLTGIVPSWTRGKTLAEIERQLVWQGNRQVPLAELFRVAGSGGDERIELSGELSSVHQIGAMMNGGEIYVAGPAGRHLGAGMTGGRLHVAGSAGDWAGESMAGGLIHILGDAGDYLGGPLPVAVRGMTGGTILVGGNAGSSIGERMRRGTIAVAGNAGEFAGRNMLAGNILIFGRCGARPGAGMKRGTIGLFHAQPPRLLPTFRVACRYRPQFLHLLCQHLQRLDFPLPSKLPQEFDQFSGDLLESGRGEILLPAG